MQDKHASSRSLQSCSCTVPCWAKWIVISFMYFLASSNHIGTRRPARLLKDLVFGWWQSTISSTCSPGISSKSQASLRSTFLRGILRMVIHLWLIDINQVGSPLQVPRVQMCSFKAQLELFTSKSRSLRSSSWYQTTCFSTRPLEIDTPRR
jgi:hypothetical protein